MVTEEPDTSACGFRPSLLSLGTLFPPLELFIVGMCVFMGQMLAAFGLPSGAPPSPIPIPPHNFTSLPPRLQAPRLKRASEIHRCHIPCAFQNLLNRAGMRHQEELVEAESCLVRESLLGSTLPGHLALCWELSQLLPHQIRPQSLLRPRGVPPFQALSSLVTSFAAVL